MKTRKMILFGIMVLIVFSGSLFASESDNTSDNYTSQAVGFELLNGRYWLTLPDFSKFMYLIGVQDSSVIIIAPLDMDIKTKLAPQYAGSLKKGEIKDLMNLFYEDTFNRKIPMIIAYTLIMSKSNGLNTEEYKNRLSKARKIWQ